MDNRDYILISWPARDVEGVIFPIIADLSHKFKIIVFVLNVSASRQLVDQLDLLKKKKEIVSYLITPQKMQGISYHFYLRKTTSFLKKYNIIKEFDIKNWNYIRNMNTIGELRNQNVIANKKCLFHRPRWNFKRLNNEGSYEKRK